MKGIFLAILIAVVLIGGAWLLVSQPNSPSNSPSQCQIDELIYYYSDQCTWCQRIKNERTIEKIQELGVRVQKINVNVGPIRHQFQGVPTFVINNQVLSGYKAFEELKKLLGCQDKNIPANDQEAISYYPPPADYAGTKGEKVVLKNGEIEIDISGFEDGRARFYNVNLPSGKTIYFFVVRDKNGIYRAAANECQVCYSVRKGFRQEGDEIVCNNCGNRYPIEKIATEKGGCNPGPINPNLEVENNQIIIKQADLEQVSDLF